MVPGVIVSSLNLVVFDPSPPDAVLEEMAALDRSAVAEFGREYSSEPWSVESFARSLPRKWTLSRCCVESRTGKILGFWVASMAVAGIVHTHWVAVWRGAWGRGAGQALFSAVRVAVGNPALVVKRLDASPGQRESPEPSCAHALAENYERDDRG
jgi:hypothetical protein